MTTAQSLKARRYKSDEQQRAKWFAALCDQNGLPTPRLEYRFAAPRMFRFDFAFLDHLVALEVNGGIWTRGRHVRGAGVLSDMEKQNLAAMRGWRILLTTPDKLCTSDTLEMLRVALSVSR